MMLRGHVEEGVCEGGVCKEGVCGSRRACVAGDTATAAVSTHPTGMHLSRYLLISWVVVE